jgi:hypothetical protein
MAQAVICQPLTVEAEFVPGSVNVGFVMDKVVLGQVYSKLFGFPFQYHITVFLHTHITYHLGDEQ